MNVIGARPDGWWRDRPAARRRLLSQLVALLEARADDRVTAVFDGRPTEGEALAESPDRLEVEFAPGGPDAADRRIAALVRAHPRPPTLTVVTSDGALAEEVRAAGAAVIGASTFRRLLPLR